MAAMCHKNSSIWGIQLMATEKIIFHYQIKFVSECFPHPFHPHNMYVVSNKHVFLGILRKSKMAVIRNRNTSGITKGWN